MITARLMQTHRILGLLLGPLILIAAGTTLALNHQEAIKSAIEAGRPPQGPFDQYVLSALADPARPERLLMGTHAGLYRSDDGGAHWRTLSLPTDVAQVGSLQADTSSPRRVYALLRQGGLFVSEDFGDHWQAVPIPVQGERRPQYLALASARAGALTVVTNAGVFAQDGTTWRQVPRPPAVRHETSRKVMQWAYDLHDGQVWGRWGVPVTDSVAITLIVLVLTGYAVTFNVGARRRRSRRPLSASASRQAGEAGASVAVD
jgi:uncharacterized iron-regulated membrane protein